MRSFIMALIGSLSLTGSATAASLCNCCGSGTEPSCAAVCTPVKPAEGQCRAAVNYAGNATIADEVNPLYGISLRSVALGSPRFEELESFRRLLESARKGVERDRRAMLNDFSQQQIDKTAADAAAKRYDDAMVNYYLGLRAYRDAFREM